MPSASVVHPHSVVEDAPRSNNTEVEGASSRRRICLIRHGESKAQEVQLSCSERGKERRSTQGKALLDCPLSGKGEMQARDLNRNYRATLEAVELVVVSPLTRALQTACMCFEGINVPIIAHTGLAEFPISAEMSGYENTGRFVEDLTQDDELLSLSNFGSVDFSNIGLKERWWHSELDKKHVIKRLRSFLRWLDRRHEKNIVLVGHCMNFMCLQKTFRKIPNCRLQECKFYPGGCCSEPKLRPNCSTKEHFKLGTAHWGAWFYLIKKPKSKRSSRKVGDS